MDRKDKWPKKRDIQMDGKHRKTNGWETQKDKWMENTDR